MELIAFEEERRMPYITSIERMGIKEGEQRGLQQGEQQGIQKVARNMLREGMGIDLIAKLSGLSIDQVQQLQAEQQ
jgi:predicted transposase/invertase (TIGR01784 family)